MVSAAVFAEFNFALFTRVSIVALTKHLAIGTTTANSVAPTVTWDAKAALA